MNSTQRLPSTGSGTSTSVFRNDRAILLALRSVFQIWTKEIETVYRTVSLKNDIAILDRSEVCALPCQFAPAE